MPTLRDVAQKAGVSVSVVSRVLNPKPDRHARVASETRARVLAVAKALGYRRNRAAEFLKRGALPAIGVFLPALGCRLVADLVFGMAEAANAEGFPLAFFFGIDAESYRRFLAENADRPHSAILTYPYFSLDPETVGLLENFCEEGGSLIVLNATVEPANVPTLSVNDPLGGALAAERLMARGCDRFVALGGNHLGRVDGFESALRAAGRRATVIPGMREIDALLGGPETPLAAALPGFFATSDRQALYLCRALASKGRTVGGDALLVGYDDENLMDVVTPALTTVHQPFRRLGDAAVRKAVRMIYGKPVASERIDPHLVIRESG